MSAPDSRSKSPDDEASASREASSRFTLPPPEWGPGRAKNEARANAAFNSIRPMAAIAEETTLRARLEEARRAKHPSEEREACVRLSRWLAARDRDLDLAVQLALRALEAGEDAELRRELATWLEGLGDAARAAEVMGPLGAGDDAVAASALLRVGVLSARAAEAEAASDAFARSAALDPDDPLPFELRGSIAGWAPEIVARDQAAEAYVEAAERRERAGAIDAQLEDLWRAVDADPTSEHVTTSLATALFARGRAAAADEALRARATALRATDPARAIHAHTKRRLDALANDDLPRALAAALDEGIDAAIDGEAGSAFDDLLSRAGLIEAIAARLELRAERAGAEDHARLLEELGRMYAGPLASHERAVDAFAGAVALDPGRTEALVALRTHAAQRRDPGPLADALVRALSTEARAGGRVGPLLACARTLLQVAEEQLGDFALSAWAAERLLALDPDDPQGRASLARAEPRQRAAHERIEAARAEASDGRGDRVKALRAFASVLRGVPADATLRARVLAEVATSAPDDRAATAEAYRAAWGAGDRTRVRALAETQLAGATETWQRVEARRQLAAEARARGSFVEANDATLALLEEAPDHRLAASSAWVNAVMAGDRTTRARAFATIAAACVPRIRAALFGVASTSFYELGDVESARAAAAEGLLADPQAVRCLVVVAEAARATGERSRGAAIERAIGAAGPRAVWCEDLADALDEAGDANYAVTWTQRLVALRPGDTSAVETLVARAVRARDAGRLGDALAWTLSQPQPAASLAAPIANALPDLASLDPERAVVIARRALDAFGSRHDALRDAMMHVAETARDDSFAAALLERWIAIGAISADRGALHADLVKRRSRMGDRDGEARAIERAVRDGFDVRGFEANLDALAEVRLGPDGEIAFLEARAALAIAKGETTLATASLRQLGASLWDLAHDRVGAARAFVRAAAITGQYAALGADLLRFGDQAFSLSVLLERLAVETVPARAGTIAAQAARAAFAVGDPGRAFDLASTALERNPLLADALEIAERGSVATNRMTAMSPLYDAVGARALGRFGRRAAHYRAARFFEQRGEAGLALKHAAEAFAAVPSEGNTFVMLARAAERASDPGVAMRAIERVADESGSAAKRAGWLLRAAAIVVPDEEGLRQRVDVLLRAALAQPDLATIAMLTDAAKSLIAKLPDEREGVLLRFARAAHKMTERAEGPDGARVSIALAYALVDGFDDVESGGDLLVRALSMDADVDEYARLLPLAASIGSHEGGAALLARALQTCDRPYANVGAPAWRLVAALAESAGDRATAARATVDAALRDPDDDGLVLAADAVVRVSDGAALADRLKKRVSDARRIEALVARGRALAAEGRHADAIEPLERALDFAASATTSGPAFDRASVERDLRASCEKVGRADRLEERALRAATDGGLDARERAGNWANIATERERRGDKAAAASALFEAAVMDPTSIARWSELERVAAAADRQDLRAHALKELASRVPPDARVDVLRRLAIAHTESGDSAAAESAWQEVWAADGEDEEADYAIEQIVVARGDYTALAEHLGRRADRLSLRSGNREALRAVRFRRAVILEQRLSRLDDACDELALLLTESPDNEGALSYLADLNERLGRGDRAAPLWRRVSAITRDPQRKIDVDLRAAEAARAAGDFVAALEDVKTAAQQGPSPREALEMNVNIARSMNDDRALGAALEQLAMSEDDSGARADRLVEAAQAAARSNDVPGAIARAQRAAKIAPTRPAAQLYARGLEYRVRGSGSPDDARATIEELGRIEGPLVTDDAALRAFLLAEAFDSVQGGGAGLHRLIATESQIGPHALVSLGLAERYVAQWKFADAVPHFRRAIGGDLFGLRKRGRVAIAAADAALRVEDHDAALAFLDLASADPDTRPNALRKLAAIVTSRGDVARSRAVLLELARSAQGDDRARTLAQLARVVLESSAGEERREALGIFQEAIQAAPADGVVRTQLQNELESLRRRPSLFPLPAAPARASSPPPPVDVAALAQAADSATTPAARTSARIAMATVHADKGERAEAESLLRDALGEGGEGSAEAGELLASMVQRDSTRTTERLHVRRQLVDLLPGSFAHLDALREAALSDHDPVYARAIEHVARAFDPGAGPLPPPPLAGQIEQPAMLAHLLRPSTDANAEPLAIAWEGAHGLFAKTPIAYAITGVERIVPGPTSPLARLYDAVIRSLGVPRIPLFHRRTSQRVEASVAITFPASALVVGDVHDDTADLRYALGHAFASALPQHVLALGLPDAQARAVWTALLAAFGPPDAARRLDKEVGKLAEGFWQSIPSRAQRRLQELLAQSGAGDFDVLLAAARQSARRVAFFVCGDFGYAARSYLRERGIDPQAASGDGLRDLCAEHAPLADLLRVAVSPEYADARWHPVYPPSPVSPPSMKGSSSSASGRGRTPV